MRDGGMRNFVGGTNDGELFLQEETERPFARIFAAAKTCKKLCICGNGRQ